VALLLGTSSAWAAPAVEDRPDRELDPSSARPRPAEPETEGESELDPSRLEIGLLPAINYNSDLGVGVGAIMTLVRFGPRFNPFRWRLTAQAFASLRDQGNGVEAPLQAHALSLDAPGLMQGRLRIFTRLAFNRQSNTGYYGLGSNAPDESSPDDVDPTFTQYDRVFPELSATARIRLWSEPVAVGKRRLELFFGTSIRYTWIRSHDDSRLALDVAQRSDDPRLEALLQGVRDHALWVLSAGLLWDTRDREFDPQRGAFHELSVRASPGVDAGLTYAGFALIARWFVPLWPDRMALATRTALDVMDGDPPVYELSRLGALEPVSAPGGARSLRGAPLQRFHGRVKLLQSLELRGRIAPFRLGDQRFMLGAAVFADVGRVWADLDGGAIDVRQVSGAVTRRDLDGDLGDFEVGLGGGARIRWGETFIIRVDVGYAPTLDTLGLYIDLGDAF